MATTRKLALDVPGCVRWEGAVGDTVPDYVTPNTVITTTLEALKELIRRDYSQDVDNPIVEDLCLVRDQQLAQVDWVRARHQGQLVLVAKGLLDHTTLTEAQYDEYEEYCQSLRDFPTSIEGGTSAVPVALVWPVRPSFI